MPELQKKSHSSMITKITEKVVIIKMDNGSIILTEDELAIEEPLEIKLSYSSANGQMQKNISVTMRTPGNDEELAAGFLFTEGIIKNEAEVLKINHVLSDSNSVLVNLVENVMPSLNNAERNFYTTSSCGICGKASIDAISVSAVYANTKDTILIPASLIYSLPELVKNEQKIFQNTGGIHASALFSLTGELQLVREDVGRHNALDKIIGNRFLNKELPLDYNILFLSGRTSFELVQKAFMAGIKIIVAVGAPSSLALDMAKECGITLIGFLRGEKFNIYTGAQRISL